MPTRKPTGRPPGRPIGARTKKRMVREEVVLEVMANCQHFMLFEVEAVLKAVAKRARDGDMTAAKLILERTLPARRTVDELPRGNQPIQINIVSQTPDLPLSAGKARPPAITIEEVSNAEDPTEGPPVFHEPKPTNGEIVIRQKGRET